MSIEMETGAVEYSSHLAHWKAAFQQLATQQPGQPRVGEQVRVCAHAAIRCIEILDNQSHSLRFPVFLASCGGVSMLFLLTAQLLLHLCFCRSAATQ
jgi:hypothetical protein